MINLEKWENVQKIKLKTVEENDGTLTCIEVNKDIPFEIRRIFLIYSVPSLNVIRGEHASENTEFFIQVLKGNVCIKLSDGNKTKIIHMNSMVEGIYVPKMTWIQITGFSTDAIVQVYASLEYEKCKYINSFSEYIKLINNKCYYGEEE